jgi:multidrug efflux pump subunit AcrA (membrane-fusion protein)
MTFFANLASRIKQFAVAHKIISAVIVIVVVGGGYYLYQGSNSGATVTKYVVQEATQGTVVSSVSGSGQVQAVTSINVQPQTSEAVTRVYVQPGNQVAAGQILVQLDTTNEAKAVQQAQISLQSAQLALAKLQEAPATTTLLGDQNAITQDQESIANASTSLAKDYQNGFDTVSSAFIDFQTVMTGLEDFANGNDISKSQANPDAYVNLMPSYLQGSTLPYREEVETAYTAALAAYQQNLVDYHAASRSSSPATLDALFSETYNTAQSISEAVKSGKDLLNFVVNNYPTSQGSAALPAITTTFQTNLGSYTGTLDSDVGNLADAQTTVTTDKTNFSDANLSLAQAQDTLTQLQAGADPLDIQSQNLSIEQAQVSLQTAEQNLAYDSIRAPIAGTISAVSAIVGETVPSAAVTMVGSGEEAVVTLNEVDAAKVAVGQKATLTFDALSNVSLAGQVVELDPVGTVSQGVVNYNVDIGFTQPADTSSTDLVKPGMSVTANIVTQVDQDVVTLPNSAVKTSGTTSYVLEPATSLSSADMTTSASGGIVLSATPKMVPVTLGLANDTVTEITSGVNVGDQVITQTITTSASTPSTAATGGTSALRALGVGGGGGGGGGFGGGTRAGGGTAIP